MRDVSLCASLHLRKTTARTREDYSLAVLAKSCRKGTKGKRIVKEILRKLKVGVRKHEARGFDHPALLEAYSSFNQ